MNLAEIIQITFRKKNIPNKSVKSRLFIDS